MKIWAIDLDGTLAIKGVPVESVIDKVNTIYEEKGNMVIIHTSRNETIREKTIEYLKILGINYHLLVMGKLRADVYVDDLNMSIKEFEAME